MKPQIIFAVLLALTIPPLATAQAVYKCKTPDGKTVISDRRCEGNLKVEEVRTVREITPEERAAAQAVNSKNKSLLVQKQIENAPQPAKVTMGSKPAEQTSSVETYHERQAREKAANDAIPRTEMHCNASGFCTETAHSARKRANAGN
jgi:hypothetical protein